MGDGRRIGGTQATNGALEKVRPQFRQFAVDPQRDRSPSRFDASDSRTPPISKAGKGNVMCPNQ
jgi:hypothetical protein